MLVIAAAAAPRFQCWDELDVLEPKQATMGREREQQLTRLDLVSFGRNFKPGDAPASVKPSCQQVLFHKRAGARH